MQFVILNDSKVLLPENFEGSEYILDHKRYCYFTYYNKGSNQMCPVIRIKDTQEVTNFILIHSDQIYKIINDKVLIEIPWTGHDYPTLSWFKLFDYVMGPDIYKLDHDHYLIPKEKISVLDEVGLEYTIASDSDFTL